ncbi:MAG: hypothetical protein VZR32_05020 [Candidatus Weimeria sp.]|nr:hypothetical protein [Candidatus Weimeria sp.]
MKWKKLFQNHTLRKGKDLYAQGQVQIISEDHKIYTANVHDQGNKIYTVQVQDLGDSMPPGLYCNCAYAQEGVRCMHMAALLLRI